VKLTPFSAAEDVDNQRRVMSGNALLDLDTMQVEIVPLPPGNWNGFIGYALNEVGGMGGTLLSYSSTCAAFPMRYMPDTGWTNMGGCSTNTGVHALNDLGDCMAWAGTWANSVFFGDLGPFGYGQLIHPSQGLWTTGGGADINNARQMLVGVSKAGLSGVALFTPLGEVCAEDLGFGGPGGMELSLCGDALTLPQSTAQLVLTGGTPGASVFLPVGLSFNPTPVLGGTLVPFPWTLLLALPADAQGGLSLAVPGAGGPPLTLYLQAVQVGGGPARFSNALEVMIGT